MPKTQDRSKPAKAPRWSSFKTPRDLLEGLWKYMGDNGHYGAVDTEPKYDVRDALRKFEVFEPSFEGRWELYSSKPGVRLVNVNIARAVVRAIKMTKEMGFGAEALVEIWCGITWIDYCPPVSW
jgi:predicted ATP-grasp superfamily ATP-dependent carboligase